MTTADNVRLGVIAETTIGVTPTTPAFDTIRATGESVTFAPTTVNSAELTPGRGVADSALTGGNVSGDINFELSKNAAFDDLLAGVMCNTWGGLGEFSSGSMPVGWDTTWIFIGDLIRSFTYMKEFDIAGDLVIQEYPGLLMNTLQLTVTPAQIITGTFGVVGGTVLTEEAEHTGQTWNAPGVFPVFVAPKVASINFFQTDMTTPLPIGLTSHCFNNFVVNVNNNVRAIECIGTLGARERALGKAEVTIAAGIYFSSNDLLDMLIDQDEFAIKAMLVDASPSPANHKYELTFPRCKLTAAPITAGGTGQDVVVDAAITALQPAAIPYSPLLIHRITV